MGRDDDLSLEGGSLFGPDGVILPPEEEEEPADGLGEKVEGWKVVIIDDDPDVHVLTRSVLRAIRFDERPLTFISGYSGADANRLLGQYPDAALLLLDVVMETETAGLEAVRYIRDVLKNHFVRILLRTGQAGRIPEQEVIFQYDINDYKEKTELTAPKFITAVVAGLRGYRDMREIERLSLSNEALERRVAARTAELIRNNMALEKEILQRRKVEEKKERIHQSTQVIGDLLRASLGRRPLEEILQSALAIIMRIPWLALEDKGGLFLLDETSGSLVLAVHQGLAPGLLAACRRVEPGVCLCGQALARKEIIFSSCLDGDHPIRYAGISDHGHYCVPILHANNCLGVLNLYLKEGHCRDPEEEKFLTDAANTLAGLIHRRRTEAERDRLAAILESTVDPVCIAAPDWRLVYLNAAGRRVMGWTEDADAMAHDWRELHPDWAWERIRDAGLTQLEHRETWLAETALRGGGDGEIPVSQVVIVHRDLQGRPEFFSSIMRDISLRKQAEEQVRRWNEELERKIRERTAELESANRELESFSYSVSHDLRGPLRALNGLSGILAEDYAEVLDEFGRECLRNLQKGCDDMSGLIDGLLQLSRSTANELRREPIDLGALARQWIQEQELAAGERRVKWRIGSGLVAVGDPGLMSAALANLLGNAWKYTAGRAEAQVSFSRSGAIFTIRDNGVGFDMAYASGLFEPFQRLHLPTEFEGAGIGLATVRRIIERHGGRIWAEGAVGEGAAFHFTLTIEALGKAEPKTE